MSKISSIKIIENKYDVYRGKDCMKNFCESLGEHTIEMILKNEVMKKRAKNSYQNAKSVIFVKEKIKINMYVIRKVKIIVILQIILIIQGI